MKTTPLLAPCTSARGSRAECIALTMFWLDEEAVTAIEYALLAALIAMIALVGIATLGSTVSTMWMGVASEVGKAM